MEKSANCANCIFNDVCGYAKDGNTCKDFVLAPSARTREPPKQEKTS